MKTKNSPRKREAIAFPEAPKIPMLISFRLNEEQAQSLATAAAEANLSSHQMAHDLVLKSLWQQKTGEDDDSKMARVLARQIFELREELALVTEKLLAHAGKISEADAAQWVDANMKPDPEGREFR